MEIAGYETGLTEAQWELMEPMLPAAKRLGRKRTPLRRILDALLLAPLPGGFPRLRKLWVDGGHSGPEFAGSVRELRPKLEAEAVKRSAQAKGFHVLARRRVVERTFGRLMRHRRLVRDHETSCSSAEAFVLPAMMRIQIRRLA